MEQSLTATSILSLFETTKGQRQSFAAQAIDNIKEGLSSPLDIHLQIKCMEDIAKYIKDNAEYKKLLLEEAQKYGKSFEYHTAKLEVKEVGTKYDYSKCGDPLYDEIIKRFSEVECEKKEREKFLQLAPESGTDIIVPGTGEVATIYRAAKSSSTSVAVTLK